MYLELSRLSTLIASLLITIGLYHQVYRIWQTRSAGDFAWTIVLSLIVNEVAWLNYGFALHEWPIIVVGLCNMPGALLIGAGFARFGRNRSGVSSSPLPDDQAVCGIPDEKA